MASDRFRGTQIACKAIFVDSTPYRHHARRALGVRLAVRKIVATIARIAEPMFEIDDGARYRSIS
jgi:hypothetical protein